MFKKLALCVTLSVLGLALFPSVSSAQIRARLQNAAVANANGETLATNLQGTATMTVTCASCSGGTTVNFEGTSDGTRYDALQGTAIGGGAAVTSATATGTFTFSVAGLLNVRARISAYSAGTITVDGTAVPIGGGSGGGGASGAVTLASGAAASGSYASGAFASGSYASGALASGSIASGALASGSIASGALASGSVADGAMVTLGAKADNKSTATDTTAVTAMQLFKEMSFQLQAIAALAATDPCAGTVKTPKPFSISSATTTVMVAASASNKLYICSFDIVVGAANNVALVEDATGSCASPDAGMAGGVTAATGWNFAANGGLVKGNGNGTVYQTASTNVNVCLMTSGTAQTSGAMTYVLAP